MSYGYNVTAASCINYGRAGMISREAQAVADKYIGGGAAKIFAAMLDDMLGMPAVSYAVSKTPVVGSEVSDAASYASPPVVQNSGRSCERT